MEGEIKNRVAESVLVTLDLEDHYPEAARKALDIKEWLMEGLILREKEFRERAKNHDWSQYKDSYVRLYCSTDAIVPGWAHMLLAAYLAPYARKVVQGSAELMETVIFQESSPIWILVPIAASP